MKTTRAFVRVDREIIVNLLKIATKATHDNWRASSDKTGMAWDDLPEAIQTKMMTSFQAGLLAIVTIPDCDFPAAVVANGKAADEKCSTVTAGLRASFRAMLLEIASAED